MEAAGAKDRIRQITRTQTDDLPTRKAMWDQLEKQKPLLAEYYQEETSSGPEYLFYGSNCINYYRDMHGNVISSYYKNIPDIKTCHDRIGDRIWKREINVTEVKNANESRSQGPGIKRG